jgi:hypothetical protein
LPATELTLAMRPKLRAIDHATPEELVSLIVGRKAREINRPAVQDARPSCAWSI